MSEKDTLVDKQIRVAKEIDAIFIGSPNQLHVPMGLEAVRNGKHVLITKPLADSERAAEKLVKAAEANGVVNMMSLSTRFGGEAIYLGNQVREGLFGRFAFGDVYARADITEKFSTGREPGTSRVVNPAKLTVSAAKSEFDYEFLTKVEGCVVDIEAIG